MDFRRGRGWKWYTQELKKDKKYVWTNVVFYKNGRGGGRRGWRGGEGARVVKGQGRKESREDEHASTQCNRIPGGAGKEGSCENFFGLAREQQVK